MKSLIVTGDDFGRSPEINEAIERCHEAGFLTQASLMVNEPAADEAVQIARRHPALCVGLHLTLCDGRASSVPSVPSLTDQPDQFPVSPTRAGLRYAFRPALASALRQEIRAQFDRFRAFGLAPTYWDGHAHLHLHPTVFRLAFPVAVEHGFHALRLVREPGPPALLPAIFACLSRAIVPQLQRSGIAFADHVFGLRDTGKMSTPLIARILENLPDGLSEFYFHPGAEPGEIDYPALRRLLDERGIILRTLPPPATAH